MNHPKDPGGETNWGITKRTAEANGYTSAMHDMTRAQTVDIYRTAFWQRYQCDKLPESLAYGQPAASAYPPYSALLRFSGCLPFARRAA